MGSEYDPVGHTCIGQAFIFLELYHSSSSVQITKCGTCCLGSLVIYWDSGSAWKSPCYC